jgi:hypothetical protein
VATWRELQNYLSSNYGIERVFNKSCVLWVEGFVGRYLMLVGFNNPGYGSDDHVTFMYDLGSVGKVDLLAVCRCGERRGLGGGFGNGRRRIVSGKPLSGPSDTRSARAVFVLYDWDGRRLPGGWRKAVYLRTRVSASGQASRVRHNHTRLDRTIGTLISEQTVRRHHQDGLGSQAGGRRGKRRGQEGSRIMTPVPWATLDPNLTEQLVSVLLCREYPSAIRIRASRGDGGIDVMVPSNGELVDVYQIKYFATPLDNSRKTLIRRSLKRISQNSSVNVRNWYLTLPLNRSPAEIKWFGRLIANAAFHCEWFGLDKIESLAAANPDVLDYYIHDGRERLERSIANLRSLVGLERPAGNQLVEPSDLSGPLTDLYELLNRDDPHYRYEYEVGAPPPESADSERPHLVARVSHGSDELAVTIRVYSRYRMATQDAPIPLSFHVDEEDLTPEALEAWERALRYGTPAEVIARDVVAGLPGGLGEEIESAMLRINLASGPESPPRRIRLGVLDPSGRLLADAVVEMDPSTHGVLGGTRAHGTEQGGAFQFEFLVDPPGEDRNVTMSLLPFDPTGKPPAALNRGIRLLYETRQPNRLAIGPEFGPLFGNTFDLPFEEAPVGVSLFELLEALAVLHQEVKADLVVPDVKSLSEESFFQILRAAALVRGETVRDTWEEQEIEYQWESLPDPAVPAYQFALQGNYSFGIGGQTIDIGQVVVVWQAAHLEVVATEGNRVRVRARPAMSNNVRLLKRGTLDEVPPTPVTPS